MRDMAAEAAIYADCARLAGQLGAAPVWAAASERQEDGLWIEVDPPLLRAFYQERGRANELNVASEREDLLEYMLATVTFGVAVRDELHNRRPGEDSRRQLFQLQEELMDRLDRDWGDNLRRRHTEILQQHPFDDRA